jgi:hypothetical protein
VLTVIKHQEQLRVLEKVDERLKNREPHMIAYAEAGGDAECDLIRAEQRRQIDPAHAMRHLRQQICRNPNRERAFSDPSGT